MRHPLASNLLVLPPDYFGALREDLQESLTVISDPKKLIILSSDERSREQLPDNTIKIDVRLQTHLGGARSSLGIRTARAILQELADSSVTVESAQGIVQGLLSRHGVTKVYNREPATDDQVVDFIRSEMSENASVSYTQILRRFRDSGRACEMKRLRRLFAATKELLHAERRPLGEELNLG